MNVLFDRSLQEVMKNNQDNKHFFLDGKNEDQWEVLGMCSVIKKRRVQGDMIVLFTFPKGFRYVEDG